MNVRTDEQIREDLKKMKERLEELFDDQDHGTFFEVSKTDLLSLDWELDSETPENLEVYFDYDPDEKTLWGHIETQDGILIADDLGETWEALEEILKM